MATKAAADILKEDTVIIPMDFEFDIFLSHSYHDAQVNMKRLLGIKAIMEELKYSVYVDWIIDNMSRETVTSQTASTLRRRMFHSRSLLFATSQTSHQSKWMPWELGYKDGQSSDGGDLGRVAILPLAQAKGYADYEGQEYLGVYPYVDRTKDTDGVLSLWVNEDANTYISFDSWLQGKKPYKRK
ncbi:MAG: toll-Interleukin receptor [Planctomycetes bacterium]|nr:toll-Interleukin receptor [Planctomycetota bacterium]